MRLAPWWSIWRRGWRQEALASNWWIEVLAAAEAEVVSGENLFPTVRAKRQDWEKVLTVV